VRGHEGNGDGDGLRVRGVLVETVGIEVAHTALYGW
jgi:hypothetical protein